jgi:hypothetical protein
VTLRLATAEPWDRSQPLHTPVPEPASLDQRGVVRDRPLRGSREGLVDESITLSRKGFEGMVEGSGGVLGLAPDVRRRWPVRAAYAACIWALVFAAAHVYWASGGTVLLGEAADPSPAILFARDPWSYAIGWAILSVLFVFAGLFPLALVWTSGIRISRSVMQTGVVSLAYAGMIVLTLFGLTAQASGLVLLGIGVCALGLVFANVRPRGQPIAGWTVLVATWGLGLAMSVYGCGYVVAAVGEIDSELFLVYLVTGGVSWLGGDALFVATARLANRREVSRMTQAPFAAESGSPREHERGATERRTS